jgi:hypothetical protein
MNGAPAEKTLSFATPDDPNLNDGFCRLWTHLTVLQSVSASKARYTSGTENATLVANAVNSQQFFVCQPG